VAAVLHCLRERVGWALRSCWIGTFQARQVGVERSGEPVSGVRGRVPLIGGAVAKRSHVVAHTRGPDSGVRGSVALDRGLSARPPRLGPTRSGATCLIGLGLVGVGRSLVAIGRALVTLRGGLVDVGRTLVGVGVGLVRVGSALVVG
jgi:hypothetical protein